MIRKLILFTTVLGLGVLLLAGCAGAPTPTSVPPPTTAATVANAGSSNPSAPNSSGPGFETQSSNGGSVTVDVKPTALTVGEPVSFDIAMNTHSVDLSDDMAKISVLRDDTGKEYAPTSWEGGGAGGHHRSGTLLFPALTSKPKSVELVIKGLAKVPERVFKWDLP